jgi:hypothetical protein
MFQARLGGESNPALPQPCFKHDRGVYPIYYQRAVSVDKGSVIIRYKNKLAYQEKFLRRATPLSRGHVSSMTRAGNQTLLSRNHVSSMTCGCTCPIYYQGVVSVEKGGVIIRYKLAELIKTVS